MKKSLLLNWLFLLLTAGLLQAQKSGEKTLSGTVLSQVDQTPLPGATVMLKGTTRGKVTDENGAFTIAVPRSANPILVFSFVGFATQELEVGNVVGTLEILMEADGINLDGVEIVSTGYQELPRERTTGSFASLDETLVNRRISTGILDRLEDVTSGLVFNRDRGRSDDISIRGTSTIFSESQPLIVLDNFPYDGPLESINPNDVESITVLKDAAAASIWGARAGNGVIVITTKNGRRNMPLQVTFTANVTQVEEQDPFYVPTISPSDFLEVEQDLFSRGLYNSRENSRNKPLLSPGVETLIALRDGEISQEEADRRFAVFASQDTRNDLAQFYYRPALQQQYAMGIRGGKDQHVYGLSVGYDKNLSGTIGNDNSRLTLNLKNDWNFLNNRLRLQTGLYLVNGNSNRRTELPSGFSANYIRLADGQGNPLAVGRGYRETFTDGVEELGLLDWSYYPLAERGNLINEQEYFDFRGNLGLGYELTKGWTLDVLYQYWENSGRSWELNDERTFYTRDLINSFTQVGEDGSLSLAVPRGSIADLGESRSQSHHLRLQSTLNRIWNERHQVAALAGAEIKAVDGLANQSRFYGYDDELGSSLGVDYVTRFRRYHNQSLANIFYRNSHTGTADRFLSYYANASYTLDKKYTLSASARKDASNIFGVEANDRGVPLWSVGGSWIISEEGFYKADWMPYLRLRTTYGYNGNINRSVSAYTTANFIDGNNNFLTRLPSYAIQNPPNPELRWERIKIINLGLDFESKNGFLSGSIEFYNKTGLDLIGDQPFPTSTGVSLFRGNFADTKTQGVDLLMNFKVLDKELKWNQMLIFNWLKEEVTGYEVKALPVQYTGFGGGGETFPAPLTGYPLFSIFSFPWAGLDGDTGDPLGLEDGEPSTNYNAILNSTPVEDLVYHGSARPTVFGSWMNNFAWRGFSLSVNISYRMGYFVRRQTLVYNNLYLGGIIHGDYAKRWMAPGDEALTTVPSFPQGQVSNRDNFYNRSEIMVIPGDHIRLQDVRLGYSLESRKVLGIGFRSLEVYGYANNLGIIWKKTDSYEDPDYQTSQALTSLSLGIRAGF
ncbi:SusC/RagA family TonB-linked outer membrane protein [uncultured Algoriphagus sp.]|uniref:SusC/RagA family TonB-linked outer membrane protein n=1 Tax=uncultured Algoriphagus sp. TaxID=417365 RepID=UPI0030EF9978